MSEPVNSPNPDASPAEKREWLRDNGHTVGLRGKLSKQHEEDYAAGRRGEARAEV